LKLIVNKIYSLPKASFRTQWVPIKILWIEKRKGKGDRSEYYRSILYTCMKIAQLYLPKAVKKEVRSVRVNKKKPH
jgi:hypothetical protein